MAFILAPAEKIAKSQHRQGGVPPVPIRWLLPRDPTGEFDLDRHRVTALASINCRF
jgi:hypothetical protein